MLNFGLLRFKNIMSVGDDFIEINFREHKTVLIIGENGAGKSTIIEAITFCLYGKPFRNINLPQLVNSINRKNLLVECEFDSNGKSYMVRRGLKPSVFEIYENGTLMNQTSTTADYQAFLENYILRMAYKTFIHVVILGSANYTPFMELKAAERRRITEEFIDLDVFSIMNGLLKDMVAKDKLRHMELQYEIQSLTDLKREKEKAIASISAARDDMKGQIETQMNDAMAAGNVIGKRILAIESQIRENGYDEVAHRRLKSEIGEFTSAIDGFNRRHKELERNAQFLDSDSCPHCKQDIAPEFRVEHKATIAEEMAALVGKAGLLAADLKKMQERAAELEALSRDRQKLQSQLNAERGGAGAQFEIITSLEKQLAKLAEPPPDTAKIGDEIAAIEEKLADRSSTYEELADKRDVYEYATALLKDSGIKARIIRQYVPIINEVLNKYLSAMDFSVSFEIDEEFKESIKSRYQDDFSYASFSQGEKARIDLALLFTWRSLAKMRNKANTNLLILDEVFDGSLDANGGDDLLSIIEEFSGGAHIFVITHKTDAYVERFEKVVRVKKQRNFTVIQDAA